MKEDIINNFNEAIKSKLGEENIALISDDIATLITENNSVVKELETRKEKINSLTSKNEMLITANGSLLQQVGTPEVKAPVKQEEVKKSFSFYDMFDEKGNFKQTIERK